MNKQTIRDVAVAGKRVLVRVDFNVPLDGTRITDDTRIRAALPTINALRDAGARVVLLSHLGRPKGTVIAALRLAPVTARLSELLGTAVATGGACIGPAAEAVVAGLRPGEVALLENVRFHPEEERNDPAFAHALAELGDIYVNDAFGAAHRAHASTEGIAHVLPAVAGLLLERELAVLGSALEQPERPFAAIIGGAKVSDKIGVIDHLLTRVDELLIGGGVANTFLRAQGYEIGRSRHEPDKVALAAELLQRAGQSDCELLLPTDVVVAPEAAADAPHQVFAVDQAPANGMILDIGPQTTQHYVQAVESAHTVIWNGPLGLFEMKPFAAGTRAVAAAVGHCPGTTIVGGGDSIAAIEQAGLSDRVTHVSTGGGASLEFLSGRTLPGVAALADR